MLNRVSVDMYLIIFMYFRIVWNWYKGNDLNSKLQILPGCALENVENIALFCSPWIINYKEDKVHAEIRFFVRFADTMSYLSENLCLQGNLLILRVLISLQIPGIVSCFSVLTAFIPMQARLLSMKWISYL